VLVTRKGKGLNDVIIDDFVADESDAASTFAFKEAINGVASHTGGKDSIESARGATSLDVAKDVDTGVESSFLLDAFAKGVDIRIKLLRDDDDGTFMWIFFSHLS
jgi:hypothetical protein